MDTNNFNIESQPIPTHPQFQNLTGQVFDRLTVIAYVGRIKRHSYWRCQCQCGNTSTVRMDGLKSGAVRSCGCLHKELVTTHGQTRSPEHTSYEHAKERCRRSNHHAYNRYGGRGIEFRFVDFPEFLTTLGKRPTLQHTLDRFPDPNGHYEIGNVRWATKKEQTRNKENNLLLTYQGVTQCASAWCEQQGFRSTTISERKANGWCDTCAITLIPNDAHTVRCPHRIKKPRKKRAKIC